MRTFFFSLVAEIGLALSAWMAVLKLGALPCFGGGCETVIQSAYGSLFGVPVGGYGAALWLGVFFARGRHVRTACLGILVLGSAVFVGLQIFVLKTFCPFCLAHASAAGVAAMLGRAQPRRWGALVALAGTAVALAMTFALAHRPPSAGQTALAAFARDSSDAFFWLGPPVPGSPALILSLTCPDCLDKISALTRLDFSRFPHGPALYFKTDAGQRGLTAVFVGAVLARPGDRREAFLAVATLALAQKELLLTDPESAAASLRALLPEAAAFEAEAGAQLARQSQRLRSAGIETTPLLVRPDGTTGSFFKLDDLFYGSAR